MDDCRDSNVSLSVESRTDWFSVGNSAMELFSTLGPEEGECKWFTSAADNPFSDSHSLDFTGLQDGVEDRELGAIGGDELLLSPWREMLARAHHCALLCTPMADGTILEIWPVWRGKERCHFTHY